MTRLALLWAILPLACAGGTAGPPPPWFSTPPSPTPRALYFVGDATASFDEASARDLAVQKALASLSQYCGAVVKSDFTSVERETNGVMEQQVELRVDIAGEELTLREAVVQETVVRKGTDGFDAFALVRWPKARYAEVLAMQKARARRALTLFEAAETAFAGHRVGETRDKLAETRRVLGPARGQVALNDARFAHTGLLWDAVETLGEKLVAFEAQRRRVVAVGMHCTRNSNPRPCPAPRVGEVRSAVTTKGLEVSATALAPDLARRIAEANSPAVDADLRTAGYVLAVTYDGRDLGNQDGFAFARCGARAVVYDTDGGRIVGTTEVPPQKGGHVHADGALAKGCGKAAEALGRWLSTTLNEMNASAAASEGASP